jgi:long-chain acyl-CoA synthetase
MRVIDWVLTLTKQQACKLAWVDRTSDSKYVREFSWDEVRKYSASATQFLLDHRVRPNDRVVNLAANGLEWAILELACSAANAIHVPLDPRLSFEQKRACIERTEPRLIFVDSSDGDSYGGVFEIGQLTKLPETVSLPQVCQNYLPQDVANILFTSGTVGDPRGVMLTHRNLVFNAMAKLEAMPQLESDHRLNLLPFAHAYARTCELTTWLASKSSMETVSNIRQLLCDAPTANASLLNGVPVLYERILESWRPQSCSALALKAILGKKMRRLASGGAPLREETRRIFAEAGLPIFQGYGLTEASPVVCSNREANEHGTECLDGVGPVVRGVQARIDDESRLWVAGHGVMAGYWNDAEATSERIVNGWLNTGDLAEYVHSNSASHEPVPLRILGRADDTIILSNGYKVHPFAIEERLRTDPRFDPCLVVGSNRPFPSVLMQCDPDQAEHLSQRVREILAGMPNYEIPDQVIPIESDWRLESELCNFKGSPVRSKIERRYLDRIDRAYRS